MSPFRTTVAAAMFSLSAVASVYAADIMSASDYAAMAASSDMFEIQSSKLALENANSADVKQFAQQMIQDHTQSTEMLMSAAKKADVNVPDSMVAKHAALLQTLEGKSGASFDSAYMQAQLTAHQEAYQLHSTYAENGSSEPLKNVAQKVTPIVKEHLDHVQGMANM